MQTVRHHWGLSPAAVENLKNDFWVKNMLSPRTIKDFESPADAMNFILEGKASKLAVKQTYERRYLEGDARSILPPLFTELLADYGVDADAALALSTRCNEGIGILREKNNTSLQQITHINLRQKDTTWVGLGLQGQSSQNMCTISWRDTCLLMPAVPQTYQSHMIGKPLRDLISHPTLDKFDILITNIMPQWEDENMIEVETDLHRNWTNQDA